MRRTRWAGVLLACALLGASGSAEAFSTGIATTSFPVPGQGCNFCHGGGVAPVVTLTCADCGGAPPVVAPLSVHEFRLTVFEVGVQDHAGLNVAAPLGTLATGGVFAAGTQGLIGSGGRLEITHVAPQLGAGGATERSFLWTAPAAPGAVTLEAWGNAVNANGSTAGDAAARVTLDVVVSGGSPTPTPEASPPTATPTATPGACPATVDAGCLGGFGKGLLLVKETAPGREKLVAKLLKGPALAQADLGNPLDAAQGGSGTAYALCVYDGAGALAGALRVDRAGVVCGAAPCWRSLGRAPTHPLGPGVGYRYKDAARSADGVLALRYKGGAVGRSKVVVVGKGAGLPDGIAAALQSSTEVTVQLRSSDGLCLTAPLSDVVRQTAAVFRAR